MKKYILIYDGGSVMSTDKEEMKKSYDNWNNWFGKLGKNLVDGGFPFATGAKVIDGDSIEKNKSELSGYSIISADNYEKALELASDCPLKAAGGKIIVFEEVPM
jgi:hypothetical protein